MVNCIMKNTASVLHAVEDIRLETYPVGEMGDNDLLIKVNYVGVCGSDIHFYKEGCIAGNFKLANKLVMGHEASGVVVQVGAGVKSFEPGNRVVLEPGVSCSHCQTCKSGRYNLCPRVRFNSVPPYAGFLQNYCVHPAEFTFKIPDNVSMEEAALVEPLCVALHTLKLAEFSIGQSILICGAGAVGLLNLLVAKCYGASKIAITDLDEERLAFAKTLGADCTIQVSRESTVTGVAGQIANKPDGTDRYHQQVEEQPDLTIECSGVAFSFQLAVEVTKPGGKIALVGLSANDKMNINVGLACAKELEFIGVRRYINCFPLALELLATGRINVQPLISHRFTLNEAQQALEIASSRGEAKAIKVLIDCSSED